MAIYDHDCMFLHAVVPLVIFNYLHGTTAWHYTTMTTTTPV